MKKTIKDGKGRDINLCYDGDVTITAYYDGSEIGQFTYMRVEFPVGYGDWCEEVFELDGMNVYSEYQGAGIGTEMIIFGEEVFDGKTHYIKDTGSKEGNHYSSEGKLFIDSCDRKGIIKRL